MLKSVDIFLNCLSQGGAEIFKSENYVHIGKIVNVFVDQLNRKNEKRKMFP